MEYSFDEIKERYGIEGIYTKAHSSEGWELYSGGENDPLVLAEIDAPLMAMDKNGNPKPYETSLSVFPVRIGAGESVESIGHRERQKRQIIQTQIIVFKDKASHERYKEDGALVIFQQP